MDKRIVGFNMQQKGMPKNYSSIYIRMTENGEDISIDFIKQKRENKYEFHRRVRRELNRVIVPYPPAVIGGLDI